MSNYNSNKDGNVKFDNDKVRLELLPQRALFEVGKVMTLGAEKYGPDNWTRKEGSSTRRYAGAFLRHFNAYYRGDDYDPETGLLHTAHMACNALFMLEAQLQDYWNDDRIKDTIHNAYQEIEAQIKRLQAEENSK